MIMLILIFLRDELLAIEYLFLKKKNAPEGCNSIMGEMKSNHVRIRWHQSEGN